MGVVQNEDMQMRKQTLPRHTNLAKQSSRTGAFLVDVACSLLFTFAFFFGCFNLIIKNTSAYKGGIAKLDDIEVNSHLMYRDDNGKLEAYEDSNSKTYENILSYYYLNYMTGEGIDDKSLASPSYNKTFVVEEKEVLPKDYYTIQWYNYNVLQIVDDNPDGERSQCYYTYQKDAEGNFDKTKIGIAKDKRYNESVGAVVVLEEKDIAGFLKKAYSTAYQFLCTQDFYIDLNQPVAFLESLSVVCSVLCGGAITYLVFPLFFKNGQTPGKKVFKLGLASYDGYKSSNIKLLLRFIPFFLTVGITLLPFWNGIIILFIIYLVMFLVSFALAMASPKKCALHDFVARTIVVDRKSSIIFDNEIDEEEYIEKEDNLPKVVQEDGDGEEPELRYEK